MRIARVRIRNFRSIKDCTFRIGNLCGLIGGNNTGKSNVLTALNFILGDRWPSVRSLDDGDFYGFNQDEDINISIWFDRTRQVRGDVGDPVDYTGILYRVTRYQRRSGRHQRGDLRSEFVCIDEEENPVQILQQPRAVRRSRPYPTTAAVTQDIRNELPAVFIDIDRNASYHLSGSQWSILGRLLRDVSNSLKADEERYNEFRRRFDHAREILRTTEFSRLHDTVVRLIEAHTSLQNIEVILDEVDPLNIYKTFSVLFKDPGTPQPVDSDRMGSGIQSAVVISLLQAYRELRRDNAVLLFEEPELFLHPHGRRHLFHLLYDLAGSGTQVIYATHSQDMVEIENLESIRLVTKPDDEGTVLRQPDSDILPSGWRDRLKLAKHFGTPRNEMLFAKSVILVEGRTEQAMINILAPLMPEPLYLDRLDCSVIEVGGKDALPILARIARSLNLRFLVIYDTDSDKTDAGDIATNERRREAIEESLGELGVARPIDPYLEEAAGIEGSGRREKERRLREFLESINNWHEVPSVIVETMEAVRHLALDQDTEN